MKNINPNSDRDYLDSLDLRQERNFPKLLKAITLTKFRNISNLAVNFSHPISVITGTNKIGKTSILMAIACSHKHFTRRNPKNGKDERATWSSFMRFTNKDLVNSDWTYELEYKIGAKIEKRTGKRNNSTRKWSGVAKLESQFDDRPVILIDLERVLPARYNSDNLYSKIDKTVTAPSKVPKDVTAYISYVFEEEYELQSLGSLNDRDVYHMKNASEYSSFNSASGEDVVSRIIRDSFLAPQHSLILIDEIEIGLHPKVIHRLVHVINNIARNHNKQFIMTTHSPIILANFSEGSRIFISRTSKGKFQALSGISIHESLTRMDARIFPILDLFIEDDTAEKVIQRAIENLNQRAGKPYNKLINIIKCGAASEVYRILKAHEAVYPKKSIRIGYAAILDGDMQSKKRGDNTREYPPQKELFFMLGASAPEKELVRVYNQSKKHQNLAYHLNQGDAHSFFEKMVEFDLATSKTQAFEITMSAYQKSPEGKKAMNSLKKFLSDMVKRFEIST